MSVLMRKYPVSNHREIITYNMLISNLYASHYLFNHPCSKYYCRYDVYTNLYNYTGNHLIYNIVYFTEGKS